MNCKRVEKLMPLYVGGDVRSGAANRIASHLSRCSGCNHLADRYRDSRNWLGTLEAPMFDEDLFRELKHGVLEQVAGAGPASVVAGDPPWGHRYAFALTVALFISLGAAAIYLIQSRSRVDSSLVAEKVMPKNTEATPSGPTVIVPRETSVADAAVRHLFKVKRHNRPKFIDEQTREEPAVAHTNSAEQAAATSTDGSTPDHQPLRIEFQTSDPNIRIIWFAQAQPNSAQSKAETK